MIDYKFDILIPTNVIELSLVNEIHRLQVELNLAKCLKFVANANFAEFRKIGVRNFDYFSTNFYLNGYKTATTPISDFRSLVNDLQKIKISDDSTIDLCFFAGIADVIQQINKLDPRNLKVTIFGETIVTSFDSSDYAGFDLFSYLKTSYDYATGCF